MGRGGSEAVVMWGAEALKRDFDVSIVTSSAIDLAALNSYYGTAVGPDEVKLRRVPIPRLLSKIRGGDAIRASFSQRRIRSAVRGYDIVFSAYNFCDCGFPAVHLLDLAWDSDLRVQFVPTPRGFQGLFHRVAPLRAAYLWLAGRIAGSSGRDMFSGGDVLLANSRWVASVLGQKYGLKCGLLYPPVPGIGAETAHSERIDDFVCMGRISEEKRLERIIEILARVRARGHQVRLRIVGGFGANIYARGIQSLVKDLPWVVLEGSISHQRKVEILRSSRYGIHGAEGEAFGIAVAEMVRAGCITFAPATGGPAEIIDHPALLYRGEDDAVEKICAVMGSERMRSELRAHLRRQADKFSAENFMRHIRAIVVEFLSRSDTEAAGRTAAAAGEEIRA